MSSSLSPVSANVSKAMPMPSSNCGVGSNYTSGGASLVGYNSTSGDASNLTCVDLTTPMNPSLGKIQADYFNNCLASNQDGGSEWRFPELQCEIDAGTNSTKDLALPDGNLRWTNNTHLGELQQKCKDAYSNCLTATPTAAPTSSSMPSVSSSTVKSQATQGIKTPSKQVKNAVEKVIPRSIMSKDIARILKPYGDGSIATYIVKPAIKLISVFRDLIR